MANNEVIKHRKRWGSNQEDGALPKIAIGESAAVLTAGGFIRLGTEPVPTISLLLFPESLTPGGPSFVLMVNGSGFVSASVVEWNGAALVTTFGSSNQLKAVVLSAAIARHDFCDGFGRSGDFKRRVFHRRAKIARANDKGCRELYSPDYNGAWQSSVVSYSELR